MSTLQEDMAELRKHLHELGVAINKAMPWDDRGLSFHIGWTRGFIRDFGFREYVQVVWIDAWKYRLANWRCWFGHELGPEEVSYEEFFANYNDCWRECQRPKCEYVERCKE